MRIHHLNCGTMCPLGGRLMYGDRADELHHLVCHCLLVETPTAGLVLVDTGFGQRDVAEGGRRLSRLFMATNRIRLRHEETARAQIERLGFSADDVRHILLTHLDFDHAGGIEDFPRARVHVTRAERATAGDRHGLVRRNRYLPAQWDGVTDWREYDGGGEPWFGFPAVRGLDGLPPEILMVPLAGHTPGHTGIAVRQGDGWLLHAGDAYFFSGEINPVRPHAPPGVRAYQRLMEVDRPVRLANQERLRRLMRMHSHEVRIVCGHDPLELATAHNLAVPGSVTAQAA